MNWSMNSFWSASILQRVSYSIRYLQDKTEGPRTPTCVRWVRAAPRAVGGELGYLCESPVSSSCLSHTEQL